MSQNWDAPTNGPVPEQVLGFFQRETPQEYRARMGYIDIPFLSDEQLMSGFIRFRDVASHYHTDEGMAGHYSANKMVWICHGCGCFGFKQGALREIFKCYGCRSRNVTVCRAGELSQVMRQVTRPPGVLMSDVYRSRQLRLAANRRAQ